MFGGKTKRPQHSTFAKLAGAMGDTCALTTRGWSNQIVHARSPLIFVEPASFYKWNELIKPYMQDRD